MEIKDRVLVVEDDKRISNFIKTVLEANNYDVIVAQTGAEAYSMVTSQCPDVVILDLGLPDMDGMDIIRKTREWSSLPIIVISARTQEKEKVQALDAGADDYMTKPFSVLELCARVRALLRRGGAAPAPKKGGVLKSGGLKLDLAVREATRDGALLELTYKEFELLRELMENAPGAMSRDELLQSVWGYDFIGETRTLDMHIGTLRHKLGDESTAPRYIKTVRGVGYRFLGEVEKEG